jgi:hypothetical protein
VSYQTIITPAAPLLILVTPKLVPATPLLISAHLKYLRKFAKTS